MPVLEFRTGAVSSDLISMHLLEFRSLEFVAFLTESFIISEDLTVGHRQGQKGIRYPPFYFKHLQAGLMTPPRWGEPSSTDTCPSAPTVPHWIKQSVADVGNCCRDRFDAAQEPCCSRLRQIFQCSVLLCFG